MNTEREQEGHSLIIFVICLLLMIFCFASLVTFIVVVLAVSWQLIYGQDFLTKYSDSLEIPAYVFIAIGTYLSLRKFKFKKPLFTYPHIDPKQFLTHLKQPFIWLQAHIFLGLQSKKAAKTELLMERQETKPNRIGNYIVYIALFCTTYPITFLIVLIINYFLTILPGTSSIVALISNQYILSINIYILFLVFIALFITVSWVKKLRKNRLIVRVSLFLSTIGLTVTLVAFFQVFFGPNTYEIKGNSMLPTYKTGEYITCTRFNKETMNLNYKDIVIFTHQKKEQQIILDSDYIKRIIALPGDMISIQNGVVYVNYRAINEPYIYDITNLWEEGYVRDGELMQVPQNSFFLMGDNRQHSSDSREFGFVSKNDITCVIPWEK